jgi:hypothetical protein
MLSTSHLAIGTTLFLSITSAFVASRPAAPAATLPITTPQEADEEYVEPRFHVEYFRTDGVSAYELQQVASSLFNEGWVVSATIPGLEEHGVVLQAVGSASIVVACVEESVPGVLELLTRLQAELRVSQEPFGAPLVTRQFQLRHVGRQVVDEALRPFMMANSQRAFPVGPNGEFDAPSITVLDESGLVMVRDSAARIEEIAALLASIDRPAPQVRLTYLLLRGYDARTLAAEGLSDADLDKDLPKDLVQDLGSLVPVVGFRRMSFGVVQGNALAPKSFSDRFAFNTGSIDLEMRPVNFDEQSGALTLERIEFECTFGKDGSSQSFSTGARLAPDEYMVLGGVGSVPVFLVLRMTRL